jgi:hypothetical protein
MSHKVAEIKGELLDFIHKNQALTELWECMVSKYSDIGKIHTRRNFGAKSSIEIIGIEEMDLLVLGSIEKFFIEKITPSGFLKVKQY